jgi:hypothetical protein
VAWLHFWRMAERGLHPTLRNGDDDEGMVRMDEEEKVHREGSIIVFSAQFLVLVRSLDR